MGKNPFSSMFDSRTTKMGRSLFGISNADSAYRYHKATGNKSAMRSAIGSKGGYTKSYNSTKKGR